MSGLLVYGTLPTFCQFFPLLRRCLWACACVAFPLPVFVPKIAEEVLNMGDCTCVKTDDTADNAMATYEPVRSTPSPCLTSERARLDLQGDRVHRCVYNLLLCSRSSNACLEYEMTAEYFTSYI